MDGNVQNCVNQWPRPLVLIVPAPDAKLIILPSLNQDAGHALARAEQPLFSSKGVNTAGLPLQLCFCRESMQIENC